MLCSSSSDVQDSSSARPPSSPRHVAELRRAQWQAVRCRVSIPASSRHLLIHHRLALRPPLPHLRGRCPGHDVLHYPGRNYEPQSCKQVLFPTSRHHRHPRIQRKSPMDILESVPGCERCKQLWRRPSGVSVRPSVKSQLRHNGGCTESLPGDTQVLLLDALHVRL